MCNTLVFTQSSSATILLLLTYAQPNLNLPSDLCTLFYPSVEPASMNLRKNFLLLGDTQRPYVDPPYRTYVDSIDSPFEGFFGDQKPIVSSVWLQFLRSVDLGTINSSVGQQISIKGILFVDCFDGFHLWPSWPTLLLMCYCTPIERSSLLEALLPQWACLKSD